MTRRFKSLSGGDFKCHDLTAESSAAVVCRTEHCHIWSDSPCSGADPMLDSNTGGLAHQVCLVVAVASPALPNDR